jgi:hypothetical protein
MTFEEDPPPVWFGQEVRVLALSDEAAGTGVVRGVSRPERGGPWRFAIEVDGEPDLVEVVGERLVPTGWFRDDEGARLSAEEHERATAGRPRPGDRLRHRHVTLTAHVVADGADEAAARARELVTALGLSTTATDEPPADEPVEYWKTPATWVVVTEVQWPASAGDDAEAAVLLLAAVTELDWGRVSGTPAGCDAVWSPGGVVGPPTPHVTWMALDAVA